MNRDWMAKERNIRARLHMAVTRDGFLMVMIIGNLGNVIGLRKSQLLKACGEIGLMRLKFSLEIGVEYDS